MENKKPTTDAGKSVGDIIKETRLSAGITVEQLSLEIKLSQEIIVAIEKSSIGKICLVDVQVVRANAEAQGHAVFNKVRRW